MISARILSRHSGIIDSIIIQCFQNNYRDLIGRLETSLLQFDSSTPSDDQGSHYLTIVLTSAGVGIALIVLLLTGFMVRKRRNRSDRAKAVIRVRKLMKDFEMTYQPSNAKPDHKRNDFNLPSVLDKINEHTSFHDDHDQEAMDEFVVERTHEIPQRIWDHDNDEDDASRQTGMSSITDTNQYAPASLRRHRLPSIATSIGATSLASTTMLMGLNIPMQTAVAARNVPDKFVDNAKVVEEDIPTNETEETPKVTSGSNANITQLSAVLDDILLCVPKQRTPWQS